MEAKMKIGSGKLTSAYIRHKVDHNSRRLGTVIKWIVFSIVSGIIVGLVGTAFYFAMDWVTATRLAHPKIIYLLPLGGMTIVGLYKLLHDEKDTGTNLVLSAISAGESVPLRMAPLIFASTLITHLFGGSAGREGAALQLGGSLGNTLGRLFRFDQKDQHVMIMCGMSAAFSALFGTPMAAAIFSMEVVTVGIMHYSALVPCVVSSLVAHEIAVAFGATAEMFNIGEIPAFTLQSAVILTLLSAMCAVISILFCIMLHRAEWMYRKLFQNPYLRAAAGGVIIIVLTFLVGNQTYNGTGVSVIASCMQGQVRPEAFFMKMLFTALTLGAGYKGGEIVPSFFIGASFGCLFGNLIGFSPAMCAAVGMTSVFCGVTNCPITSLLISFELFGYDGMPYFLLAVAFSYMLSGYYSLYSEQKIIYSKLRPHYVNLYTNQEVKTNDHIEAE